MEFKDCYRAFLALLILSFLSACATQVTSPTVSSDFKVRALQHVTVEYEPEAKRIGSADKLFDIEALQATLERDLAQRQLMAPNGDFDLKVLITEVQMRSTASAVLLGIFAGDDHVIGDAVVLDRSGEAVYTYTAKASYALGGVAGSSEGRLDWLYNEFSTLISDELAARRAEAPGSQDIAADGTVVGANATSPNAGLTSASEADPLVGIWEGTNDNASTGNGVKMKATITKTSDKNYAAQFSPSCSTSKIKMKEVAASQYSIKLSGKCEGEGQLTLSSRTLKGEVTFKGSWRKRKFNLLKIPETNDKL